MSIQAPVIQSIEVVRAEVQLLELAHELVMLSTADNVVEVDNNRIALTYVGRGSESITLCLGSNYSDEMRIQYARENLARLKAIKSDLLCWAA